MLKADTLAVYKKCAVKSFVGKFKDEYRKIECCKETKILVTQR